MRSSARLLPPDGRVATAYNRMRANLLARLSLKPNEATVIAVSAVHVRTQEPVFAANLALSFARLGLRVLLVDLDYHSSGLAAYFHEEAVPGVYEATMGQTGVAPKAVDQSGLQFLPRGYAACPPADFAGRVELFRYLDALRPHYDVIFLSLPAACQYAELSACANRTDGVVLTTVPGRDKRRDITSALTSLSELHANLLGIVSMEM